MSYLASWTRQGDIIDDITDNILGDFDAGGGAETSFHQTGPYTIIPPLR